MEEEEPPLDINYFTRVFERLADDEEQLSGERLVEMVLYYSRERNDDHSTHRKTACDIAIGYAARIGEEIKSKKGTIPTGEYDSYFSAVEILSRLRIDRDTGVYYYTVPDTWKRMQTKTIGDRIDITSVEIEKQVRILNKCLIPMDLNSPESDKMVEDIERTIESRSSSRSNSEVDGAHSPVATQPVPAPLPAAIQQPPALAPLPVAAPAPTAGIVVRPLQQIEVHETGIERMIAASLESDVFYITTDQAINRHIEDDIWLIRWGNPCLSLNSSAMESFVDVLGRYNSSFVNMVITCGMAALIRNEGIRKNEHDLINSLLHASTDIGKRNKTLQSAREQMLGAKTRLDSILHLLFHDFLERTIHSGSALSHGLNETNIESISNSFNEVLSSPNPMNLLLQISGYAQILVEMILSMGVCVVLRWVFELKQNGYTIEFFFEGIGVSKHDATLNILTTEINKCGLGNKDNQLRHLRKYLGSLIHCTQAQGGHFLQSNTWTRYHAMIRRDLSDFVYSFMGDYQHTDPTGAFVKYIRPLPTVITEGFFNAHLDRCQFPGTIVSTCTFINPRNDLPVNLTGEPTTGRRRRVDGEGDRGGGGRPRMDPDNGPALTRGDVRGADGMWRSGGRMRSQFTMLSTLDRLLDLLKIE